MSKSRVVLERDEQSREVDVMLCVCERDSVMNKVTSFLVNRLKRPHYMGNTKGPSM